MREFVGGICAATLIFLSSHGPAIAAPDNTRGAALMFAVVNANGTLARGSGVSSSALTDTDGGLYEVIFDRDVTSCAYTVSVGSPDASGAVGVANAALRAGNSNGVFVTTGVAAGGQQSRPFHLLVFCTR